MKKKLYIEVLLLVVTFLCLGLHSAKSQSIPVDYLDPYQASNYRLDRSYSLGYMNSNPFSNAYLLQNSGGDISALSDNPASGVWVISEDRRITLTAGYLPVMKNRYQGNIGFAIKTGYNFSWHGVVSMKSIGVQDLYLSHPFANAFTNESIPVLHDGQDAQDWRAGLGMSFHPSLDSKWSFGMNFNFMHTATLTGTFNLNAQDQANLATIDIAAMHNAQDEDGNGITWGARIRNMSFANKYSTINYSPGTTEKYERMYGMKRYIPGYFALGGGYRVSTEAGETWGFGAEAGPELGSNIPDTTNVAAMKHYVQQGAVKNMFGDWGGFLMNVHVLYSRPLTNWNLECRLAYMADSYTKAPYLNLGLGTLDPRIGEIHFYVGYLIPAHNSNLFGNQVNFGFRLAFIND